MFVGLIAFAYVAICLSVICRKMGFSPMLGLAAFVPVIGYLLFPVLLWYMAFAKWPRWLENYD